MRSLGRSLIPLVFAGALLSAPSAWSADDEAPRLKAGMPAPSFTLKAWNPKLSGTKLFALRRAVGPDAQPPKTVVLSFAASFCAPCKQELRDLKPHAERFRKAGVEVVVVVTDTEPAEIEKMRAFTVDELKLPFPVLSDRFGVLAKRYQADQLPKSVIIGKDGLVKHITVGYAPGSLERLEKMVGLRKM